MKKGIIRTGIFYSCGVALTALTYLVFGGGYAHGPGWYVLVIALTILVGLFWTVTTVFNFYFKKKTEERKGMIYSQVAVLCLIGAAVLYTRYSSFPNKHRSEFVLIPELKEDVLATASNDATKLFYGKTLILLKVKDSIHFDKRDSLDKTFKK